MGVVSVLLAGQFEFESQYGREIFPFSKMCRPTLEPTQHRIQLVLVFFPGYTVTRM